MECIKIYTFVLTKQKNMKTTTTKAAFQSWYNGEKKQFSGLYLNKDAEDFVEKHFTSGTFATLHTFDTVEKGQNVYNLCTH